MIKAIPAKEANKTFIRKEGWTGADGVYQHRIGPNIYWYFSDTFIGEVDNKFRRLPGYRMVHHSFGVAPSNNPFQISFIYPEKETFFQAQEEGYHWLLDGIRIKHDFYLNCFRINGYNQEFVVEGVDVFRIPIQNDKLLLQDYQQVQQNHDLIFDNIHYSFGISILDQSTVDGYIYVFGVDHQIEKHLVVYKTKDYLDPEGRLYLSPYGWKKNPQSLRSLASPVANEFKVIYLKDQYHLAFSPGGISEKIIYSTTSDLELGFYNQQIIYKIPEYDSKHGIITYNAKLQCFEKDCYISYHVNTVHNEDHVDAKIYRPRFLKIKRGRV